MPTFVVRYLYNISVSEERILDAVSEDEAIQRVRESLAEEIKIANTEERKYYVNPRVHNVSDFRCIPFKK